YCTFRVFHSFPTRRSSDLYLLLRVFGDFRTITITQNLLGLLAGGMFLLIWRRIRDFIPSARLPHPIYNCLGLLAVAIYLFSREPDRKSTRLNSSHVSISYA